MTGWTIACQSSLSMGFSRQEYCSGWSFPLPGGLNPGTEPVSPALAGGFFITELSGKPYIPVSLLMSISIARLFSIMNNCVYFANQCHILILKVIFYKHMNSKFPEYLVW